MKPIALKPLKEIDPRCREDIFRAVRGEPSAWPADNHPTHGTYQERFERGDKQVLLWTIVLAANERKPIPKWALAALERVILDMATGCDWKTVFGSERAERGKNTGANRTSIRQRAEKMYKVWDFIQEQKSRRIGRAPNYSVMLERLAAYRPPLLSATTLA